MRVGIGCDNNALAMKNSLKEHLIDKGYEVVDFGCHSEDAVDYPDVAFEVAEHINKGKVDRGILLCGTGLGMAIAANKYPGIRAATTHDIYSAERAQLSNNAQIITLGAQIIGVENSKRIADAFLSCEFDVKGRSTGKVQKIIDKETEILSGNHAIDPETSCS